MKKLLLRSLIPMMLASSSIFSMQELPEEKIFQLQECTKKALLQDLFAVLYPLRHTLGQSGWVNNPQFSPDSSKVVAPSSDGTTTIWDVAFGKLLRTLTGHSEVVWDASFSPNSSRVVTASSDGTAKIWDLESGNPLYILRHSDTVWSAKFSSDGRLVVTASQDGTAKIWGVESGKLLHVFYGPRSGEYRFIPLWSAQFSSDDSKIIGILGNGKTNVWDVTSGNLIDTIAGGEVVLCKPNLNHDGSKMVIALPDRTVQICDNGPWKARILACLIVALRLDQAIVICNAYEATKAGYGYKIGAESDEMMMLGSIGRKKIGGVLQPIDQNARELQRFLKNILNIRIIRKEIGGESIH